MKLEMNIKIILLGGRTMNQFMAWICLISLSLLSLQVMVYICSETLKLFNIVALNNRNANMKVVNSKGMYNYENKIAK